MSVNTNPDRIYVDRQYRAKIRMAHDDATHSCAFPDDVILLNMGATLVNISAGGCCLRLSRSDLPFAVSPGCYIPFIKLLHPNLDSPPVKGRVAWSKEEPHHVLVGIQFTELHPEALKSIHSYTETCSSKFVRSEAHDGKAIWPLDGD